jgi:CRP/FNR family transcriptional activator FtrB
MGSELDRHSAIDTASKPTTRTLRAAWNALARLAPEAVEQLSGQASLRDLRRGAVVFLQGAMSELLFAVASGQALLTGTCGEADATVAGFAGPGETLGLSAAVLDAPYPVGATVTEESRLIAIPARLVRGLLESDARFARAVALELAREVGREIGRNLDLKLRSAPRRLAAYLLELSGGRNGPATLRHERRHLAAYLGMTPESLSRAFAELAPAGIHGRGSTVFITDLRGLREFAAGKPRQAATMGKAPAALS